MSRTKWGRWSQHKRKKDVPVPIVAPSPSKDRYHSLESSDSRGQTRSKDLKKRVLLHSLLIFDGAPPVYLPEMPPSIRSRRPVAALRTRRSSSENCLLRDC